MQIRNDCTFFSRHGTLRKACLQVIRQQSDMHCILLKSWDLIWDFSLIFLNAKSSAHSHFIAEKSLKAKVLPAALVELAVVDLHVAASE